ncbi:adenosylcobinamide-phosphate synthase CbiB [Anaerospora hongkongensis]|uniref:adenosylcobinamide-phosphate synthase CbiB n=1 Tax=Anaerospora hongkongensis TaxID=244830 RepID=UPI002898EAA2|nr:adenosylcobinamide-phosphate synthase CbiB [Anaerospora hongkongensis]
MTGGLEKWIPLGAVLFDSLIGDPRSRLHPVVLIGNYISLLEKALRRSQHSPGRQLAAGAVLVAIVLLTTYAVVGIVIAGLEQLGASAAFWGKALILSFAITPRSLAEAGMEICRYLRDGNMEQARFKVGWIVGRDTQRLDEREVTRATVETVAENIVDGIISPLVYFAIGGAPLAFLYRAVNTLDSMVGYKNDKYLYFGRVAARVDDIFNYVPARITGVLLVIAAFLLGYNAKGAAKMIWRDAAKHPSPNSGIAEAGVAGALGVRLGGLNYYGGVASQRAYMGDEVNRLSAVYIQKTVYIMYVATVIGVLLITLIQW